LGHDDQIAVDFDLKIGFAHYANRIWRQAVSRLR
jgi:hypothetical protein